jgi:hypothetical protein
LRFFQKTQIKKLKQRKKIEKKVEHITKLKRLTCSFTLFEFKAAAAAAAVVLSHSNAPCKVSGCGEELRVLFFLKLPNNSSIAL